MSLRSLRDDVTICRNPLCGSFMGGKMGVAQLSAERQAIIDRFGVWGSANIALPFGLFTMDANARGDNLRNYKFLQVANSLSHKPLNQLRVVDLGCGEGLYSVELAQQGANVTGIEGRSANLTKAEFARRAWDLQNLKFVHDDVRNFGKEKYGSFDLIICSGILYHLDQPDCFQLIKSMRLACLDLCIIDTRIAISNDVICKFDDKDYCGCFYNEHSEADSFETRISRLGSSLDNVRSFWFTRNSLTNFLLDNGFNTIYDVMAPVPKNTRLDRVTLAASVKPKVHTYNAVESGLDKMRWPLVDIGVSL